MSYQKKIDNENLYKPILKDFYKTSYYNIKLDETIGEHNKNNIYKNYTRKNFNQNFILFLTNEYNELFKNQNSSDNFLYNLKNSRNFRILNKMFRKKYINKFNEKIIFRNNDNKQGNDNCKKKCKTKAGYCETIKEASNIFTEDEKDKKNIYSKNDKIFLNDIPDWKHQLDCRKFKKHDMLKLLNKYPIIGEFIKKNTKNEFKNNLNDDPKTFYGKQKNVLCKFLMNSRKLYLKEKYKDFRENTDDDNKFDDTKLNDNKDDNKIPHRYLPKNNKYNNIRQELESKEYTLKVLKNILFLHTTSKHEFNIVYNFWLWSSILNKEIERNLVTLTNVRKKDIINIIIKWYEDGGPGTTKVFLHLKKSIDGTPAKKTGIENIRKWAKQDKHWIFVQDNWTEDKNQDVPPPREKCARDEFFEKNYSNKIKHNFKDDSKIQNEKNQKNNLEDKKKKT